MTWNFNIDEAPRGRWEERTITRKVNGQDVSGVRKIFHPDRIIVASQDGVTVTVSHWIPPDKNGKGGNRWNMLGSTETPVAWWPFPEHPRPMPPERPRDDH